MGLRKYSFKNNESYDGSLLSLFYVDYFGFHNSLIVRLYSSGLFTAKADRTIQLSNIFSHNALPWMLCHFLCCSFMVYSPQDYFTASWHWQDTLDARLAEKIGFRLLFLELPFIIGNSPLLVCLSS